MRSTRVRGDDHRSTPGGTDRCGFEALSATFSEALRKRLTEATTRLHRLRSAVEAGADPAALIDAINTAQAERAAAQAELDSTPEARTLSDGIYAMIDSLGDVRAALRDGKPESLSKIYDSLQLRLKYEPPARAVEATISPRVVTARVRGESCALSTRIELPVPG